LLSFAIEFNGVFQSELIDIFLSKIGKQLFDLASPSIILDYNSKATLLHAFEVVKKYNKALC